ncbi:MAG: HAD hydrolase-like protein [Planctomycetes bacterium]|nr:HAD hydrolase-like protein [Planctomycetota bacterium]
MPTRKSPTPAASTHSSGPPWQIATASPIPPTPTNASAATHVHLKQTVNSPNHNVHALPGVLSLLDALRAQPDRFTLGLLTGNYPENGRLKLESVGINPDWFTINVWGIDGPTRNDLPPVGVQRYEQHTGTSIDPSNVIIIGDTLADIECAQTNSCRVAAVATGGCSHDQLEPARPDLLLHNLKDGKSAFLNWVTNTL